GELGDEFVTAGPGHDLGTDELLRGDGKARLPVRAGDLGLENGAAGIDQNQRVARGPADRDIDVRERGGGAAHYRVTGADLEMGTAGAFGDVAMARFHGAQNRIFGEFGEPQHGGGAG